jgi:hypothetical protein
MSEEIVACPGCAKKFRIPEGAPPGSFACTACEADVPYGAPPAKAAPAKGPARPAPAAAKPAPAPARPAPAARPAAAPARAAAAPARQAPAASSRRAAPAARRSSRGGHDEDAPKKDNHGAIWAAIGIGGVALMAGAYFLTRPKTAEPPAKPPVAAPTPAPTPAPVKPKVEEPPKTEPATPEQPKPEAPPVAEAPKPEPPKTETPKPDPAAQKPPVAEPSKPAKGDYAQLGQTFANVEGMTDAERETADRLVTTAMDMGAGKDGSEAESKLAHMGKKAIPSILTAFGKQYTGGKWATDSEQWSADKLQDLLHRIAGADGLNPREDFWPRFGSGASAADFEKAANLWIKWWHAKGQFATKYRRSTD